MKLERNDKRVVDLAWEEIDAKRDLQKIRILLEEAMAHIEFGEELSRDALNAWLSSALILATKKSKGGKK